MLPHSDGDGSEISQQSSTLPRRHRRHISSESTFMIWSRDCSPIRRHSPHYSSGSLPRSIHSGHSKSKMRLQSRSPAEECARAQQRHRLDEKINQEREKHFRSMQQQQSGPSSLESGKTSVMSGPSSIDSGKNSSSRTTSCMSSLESNGTPSIRSSTRRVTSGGGGHNGATNAHQSSLDQYLPSIIANSMSNNSITLQVTTTTSSSAGAGGGGGGGNTGNNVNQISASNCSNNGRVLSSPAATSANGRHHHNHHSPLAESASTSSGSSSQCSNSTKIYVQNSPARSVIKLENGKLADNANVLIINKNETIAGNNHKEVILFNSLQQPQANGAGRQLPLETQFDHVNGDCYVVFRDQDQGVMFSGSGGGERVGTSQRYNGMVETHQPQKDHQQVVINNKLNNLTLDHPEGPNYHRKLSLQTSASSSSGQPNLSYHNLLRQTSPTTTTTTPVHANKINLFEGEPDYYYAPHNNSRVSGSVGCLGADTSATPLAGVQSSSSNGGDPVNKQLNTGKSYSQNKLNDASGGFNDSLSASNHYLSNKLKSLNSIDSLATIYQKSNSLMTVGSEPNLMELKVGGEKLNNHKNDKLNNMIPRKETNLTKSELDPAITGSEDMYDFPSLTDLSFNSLAALKILQELNSEKVVKPATMCP